MLVIAAELMATFQLGKLAPQNICSHGHVLRRLAVAQAAQDFCQPPRQWSTPGSFGPETPL